MQQPLTYPGVYIDEVASGVRPIAGVATSVAAFVGRARKGTTERAVLVTSYGAFIEEFGELWASSRLGYAVRDFYLNGGRHALVCRLYVPPAGRSGRAALAVGDVAVEAASPGAWANRLRLSVDHRGLDPAGEQFNLTVTEKDGRTERFAGLSMYADRVRNVRDVLARESRLVRFAGTLAKPAAARTRPADGSDTAAPKEKVAADARKTVAEKAAAHQAAARAKAAADRISEEQQQAKKALTEAEAALTTAQALPDSDTKADQVEAAQKARDEAKAALDASTTAHPTAEQDATEAGQKALDAEGELKDARAAATTAEAAVAAAEAAFGGDDGGDPDPAALKAQAGPLLTKADIFNLLCIPPYTADGRDVEPAVYNWAAALCAERRALLLVDPPSSWTTVDAAKAGIDNEVDEVGCRSANAALYFPRLLQADPLRGDAVESFVPCGAVAGVMARIDGTRGVWKAPAGLEAGLRGVQGLAVGMDDEGNGLLNPRGVNCLRGMGAAGRVVWGARTLVGADSLASEWKYVPVRRLALFIEESLYRGTRWVVFEPNDEPLWAQIRLNVGSFMHQLFRQRAFQGRSPREAYFVKCDAENTTQADRDRGVVNIHVGFAPLKPAEFVVVRLQQMAGQTQA